MSVHGGSGRHQATAPEGDQAARSIVAPVPTQRPAPTPAEALPEPPGSGETAPLTSAPPGPAYAPLPAPPGTALVAPGTSVSAAGVSAAVAQGAVVAAPTGTPATPLTRGTETPTGRPGTVYGGGPGPTGTTRRSRYAGRLNRLRIGSHTASLAALGSMSLSPAPSGLLLGVDRDQRPVPVRFFRAEPTRITLIGGEWAGQILAFRALALGTRVIVVTTAPGPWHGFGERAVGRGERLTVVPPHQPLALGGTAARPALVIYDIGPVVPPVPAPLAAWHTQLTVLRELTMEGAAAVQEANLVVLQRLQPLEAQIAASVLRLTPQTAALLQVLEPDMVALLGGGADRYVWLSQTRVEQTHTGPPRR